MGTSVLVRIHSVPVPDPVIAIAPRSTLPPHAFGNFRGAVWPSSCFTLCKSRGARYALRFLRIGDRHIPHAQKC